MPILNTDIIYRLSGGSGNSDPAASLGGVKSTTTAVATTLNGFFGVVTGSEASAGDTEYRCFYVHNAHATLTLYSTYIWISSNTPSTSSTIDIAVGSSAVNGTEQTVANENTAPTSVSFSAPSTYGTGLLLGDLPAGQHRAVWVRRTITAGASAYASDTVTINVQGDTPA